MLPLVAAAGIFVMGAAAFGIDIGWLLLNNARQQTAADAAALAAVIHMPDTGVAFDVARGVAIANGYVADADPTVTPKEVFTESGVRLANRLEVEVERDVSTFFLRAFGVDSVRLSRSSTAEYIPPLQLGSDDPLLGSWPGNGADPLDPDTWAVNRGFWVAANARFTAKEHGDPYLTRCLLSTSISSCNSINDEYQADGYFYGIDVPAGATSLNVELFDARFWGGDGTFQIGAGDGMFAYPDAGGDHIVTLYGPDTTPFNPADNDVTVCPQQIYTPDGTGFGPGDPSNFESTSVCGTVTVGAGLHVLQIQSGAGHSNNGFSIRATTNAGPASVFGIGRMSLFANQDTNNPVFKLAKVTPVYAGRELTISLFDPGEAVGNAWVIFRGGAENLDCSFVVRRDNGTVEGPSTPGTPFAGADCWVKTSNAGPGVSALYNGDWLDFSFDVPPDYDCDPTDQSCWWTVEYRFAQGDVQDRTTWEASVRGTPVRLVLDE